MLRSKLKSKEKQQQYQQQEGTKKASQLSGQTNSFQEVEFCFVKILLYDLYLKELVCRIKSIVVQSPFLFKLEYSFTTTESSLS